MFICSLAMNDLLLLQIMLVMLVRFMMEDALNVL